ncbi:hypothetical protein [Vibrio anguillarum]|uniref:hypothetical protein n=1 Tax=Vibrio anguillarum TaxID=55601 RepID=UPI000BB492C3|nr:hypothetical protein [Vibrio anguillarum]ATC57284.1 hypothetical protein CMV05_06280 [Vibrio anguillarum]MBF4250915.1 hypothetical protein [Vibrio anguillarum]MBF4256947.1 hypothetical protein [Vibrio anguillarum]MBF4278330.1 hypothetical protein [Vibrio anguillarum]MBF4298685.1 hypothetical protein [Vibrio anguillarum]
MKRTSNMRITMLIFLGSIALNTQALASEMSLTLHLPTLQNNTHAYYHELLQKSLEEQGVKVNIIITPDHVPQKRISKMVENNQLSLMWFLQTQERDERYAGINIPLTKGLIGKRILLIPPQLQPTFDTIHSLSDLQKAGLTAGLGVKWYDVEVWRNNDLKVYQQDGDWRNLYQKLSAEGPIHYFPRGMNEVSDEAKSLPYLTIEQRLILQYQSDFIFYLSQETERYQPIIDRALRKAQNSGLMDKLIEKHWGNSLEALHPESRTIIHLDIPQ